MSRTTNDMTQPQPNLFDAGGTPATRDQPRTACQPRPSALSDAALIASIPNANLADASALAEEAAKRRLVAAVPALEELCRRFIGFGLKEVIPEQAAALEALAMIGGRDAAAAVARIICQDAVQGPGLTTALSAAVRLGSQLPREVALPLLAHDDPDVRALACRFVRDWPEATPILVDLLGDLRIDVATAAACALGRLGRAEGKRMLVRLLATAPTPEVIDAVTGVADEDCMTLIARAGQHRPELVGAARNALERIDHPRAVRLLASLPS
jgi:hypothetical protein